MRQETPKPFDLYSRRANEVQLSTAQANKLRGLWLVASVVLAFLCCTSLYESLIVSKLAAWIPFFPLAALVVSVKQTKQHYSRVLRLLSLHKYYEKGIARLRQEWDLLDDGKDFVDPAHLYATDLDLFGRGSLFQLVSSARTHLGRETLASWMKDPAVRDVVYARWQAISELRERRDLFDSVGAAGTSSISDCRPGTFRNWVAEMSSQPSFPLWAPLLPFILVPILLLLPFFYWTGRLNLQNLWVFGGVVLALEAIFAAIFFKRVRFIIDSVRIPSIELPILCELARIIERENFSSERLVKLTGGLKGDNRMVSRSLYRLNRLIRFLEKREFPFFLVLLWGTQFSMAIDRWHRSHGSELLESLTVIGEFEALLSLSTYAFEHPRDVFPEFIGDGPLFDAKQLGHPLLDASICVLNDVRLGDESRFLIVSGSNMSGKSTFLRAIGANAVLASMGAPVRCAKLRLSEFKIAAAIRVQDSLTDGRSHFFAEMDRLRQMIDLAGARPLLFLVDEMMSGTNSHDRRIAAEWVIRALMRRNSIGLITTHDLTLTEIATNGLPGRNVYFEDSGTEGKLNFDYKLRSGLLTRSNALNIVRMLGIDAET